ncbi:acetaldehyde dehydrogenase (acetylating) [Kitasatospora sp. NPDC101801]|uniref:acetaldehyde dehydrogenase (acetylating) n=1 Tax=Kitasatospora sp. NPDC101801 TaxID=3364103 RepID=UPI003828E8A7
MNQPTNRLRAAVLGTGKIGMDLAERLGKSAVLECALIVGRDETSVGLRRAAEMGLATAAGGIAAFVESGEHFDVVFDASNAAAHRAHWDALAATGAVLVDLTPSSTGTRVVPTVNGEQAVRDSRHFSMISCGGQTAIPVLAAIAGTCTPGYVEVVATAATASTGRGTWLNIDEYLATTQAAVTELATGPSRVKALLNLSPATPEPPFRVQVTVLAPDADPVAVQDAVAAAADRVRAYAPGYTVTSCTTAGGRIDVALEVTAHSSHLPWYAGNLDIINAAAVHIAERCAATLHLEGATRWTSQ